MTGGWGTPSWMGGEPAVGETFVWGQDPQTARDLLDAADALGLDRQTAVRTVRGGFIVPDAVWDAAQETRADRDGTGF